MICIMTENQKLIDGLTSALSEANLQFRLLDPKLSASLAALYSESVTGAVVDEVVGGVPDQAWLDLLGSLGRRMPIFVLGTKKHGSAKKVTIRNAELFTYVSSSSPNDLLSLMMASGAIASPGSTPVFAAVPFFNIQVPLHMLKSTGAVSLISINATGLRKIAIDFGVEAYQRLQKCFQNILNSMWGSPGCFRRTDILMRRSTHSNTYYVILEQSRRSLNVPAPGVIEKMADRIALRIQKEMWNEIYKFGADRKLPDCISLAPEVSVGYSTALHNPCVDSYEIIEHLIEASSEVAKVQGRRIKDRACELMHTLIQTDQLLYPNYQGVFTLPGLTKEMVDTAKAENSIKAYSSLVYGFEALIRVRSQIVQEAVSGDHLFHMEARLLRPDILFALAHEAKVALELDQVCLALGVRDASD
ncbi:MAG: hypothetical protein NTV34_17055, partial [Proteobacteria bacterium]|nr:hypothetical protein [Pseudomonadota bacterium]